MYRTKLKQYSTELSPGHQYRTLKNASVTYMYAMTIFNFVMEFSGSGLPCVLGRISTRKLVCSCFRSKAIQYLLGHIHVYV